MRDSLVVSSTTSTLFRHGFSCRNREAALVALKKALYGAGLLGQVRFVAEAADKDQKEPA